MKSLRFICVMLLLSFFWGCSGDRYQIREDSHGKSDTLNYDYTNQYVKQIVRRDHFALAVTVESPVIISFGDIDFSPIYDRSGIEGNAILKVTVTSGGKVSSLQFVKNAGLGLDEYIEKMVRASTFTPVRYRGKDQMSSFIVNVLVKEL